jgi:hypothetical protein
MLELMGPERQRAALVLTLLAGCFTASAVYYRWKSATWSQAWQKVKCFFFVFAAALVEVGDGP